MARAHNGAAYECLGLLCRGREFEKRNLQFLETLEDRDLLCEIGYRQLTAPMTLKQALLLGLGSIATVQRRLRRLREIGAIQTRRSSRDKRAVELLLSPRVMRVFEQYCDLVKTSG